MPVRGAYVGSRPADHLRALDPATSDGRSAVRPPPCGVPARGRSLSTPDDHDGVGDHPAVCLRDPGDLHGGPIASLHLVVAEPHPHAAVVPLVYLGPPGSGGGADTET